jgi:DNA replication protein DnaC
LSAVTSTLGLKDRKFSFPTLKDLETYDFSAAPNLSKQKILELSRCQWIDEKFNACFIGNAGTGKTHLAVALGQAACRQHKRVRFFTAATLVNILEEAQKQYRLDRFLGQLDKADLLVIDELGYLSFSRGGAELLFQVFADRYERGSILITSNLPFGEWGSIFQGERMTAALLDRFTHRCHIFELNGESFRFKESSKQAKEKKTTKG